MFPLNFDYTTWIVLLGTSFLGLCAGILSPTALIKKESMLGDVIAHASFPGIVLGFVFQHLLGSDYWVYFFAFAVSACVAFLFFWIKSNSRLTQESIQAALLTFFFAVGVVLLSIFQKKLPVVFSSIKSFLLGSAASLLIEDVVLIFLWVCLSAFFWLIYRRKLKVFLFDRQFYRVLYGNSAKLEVVFLILMIVTIILGLRAVGIILMAPLLVFPALISENFSKSFESLHLFSICIGILICLLGSFLSLNIPGLPTGPIIVILFASVLSLSWIFRVIYKKC